MRNISVSTEVFAAIWAHRKQGEETEDAILGRILLGLQRFSFEPESRGRGRARLRRNVDRGIRPAPAGRLPDIPHLQGKILHRDGRKRPLASAERQPVLSVAAQIELGGGARRRERLEELELQGREGTNLQDNAIEARRSGQEENESIGLCRSTSRAWRSDLPHQYRPEIVDIGAGRARHEQVADRMERRPGVVAGEPGLGVDAGRPHPRDGGAVGEGAGIVLGTVDAVGVGGQRMDALRRRRCRARRRAGIRCCARPCPWRAASRWSRHPTGSAPAS